MRRILAVSLLFVLAGCAAAKTGLSPEEMKLATEAHIDSEIAARARAQGRSLERLLAMTPDHDEAPSDGLVVVTDPGQGRKALQRLRKELAGSPYRAYLRDDRFGNGADRLAVVKGDDYGYLATVRTDGINYDLDHDRIMERYRAWDARYGLKLVGAGTDWLEVELVTPPADWQAFAEEVYRFCPDVVDQGTGDVEALAAEMKAANTVFLWWD
ncbi:DUF4253 domain-containing protein [Lysobacter solisilvae (ex Woo and Kim 2020)]|uniref:DUF4253 domain-containing protein n=1 Tax=Agrilutibacter terrestris TaxID=2865112 RepID=A0A7H0G108_9GAMM|nr:DUF4253 domain-containing protein [Lysobacter terrestris]QNP41974.1 DUF4253 domain-containing protein [Lysobacter terrestris]